MASYVLDRILELRQKNGWTEYELSVRAGMAQTTINSWYRKNQTPTIPSLEKICRALGVTMSQFFATGDNPSGLTKEQTEMMEHWTRLTDEQKELLLQLMGQMK